MNTLTKLLSWLAGIALLTGLYFSDNIRGYYRFKEVCEKEAGLKVFEPLERNVGWSVRGRRIEDTGMPVLLSEVAFVRYRNEKDGNLYDVFRAPKLKVGDPGYAERPADLGKVVIYEYRLAQSRLERETRMGATEDIFVDLRTAKVVATYKAFSYGKFDPGRTVLAAPSGEFCPDDPIKTDPKTGKYLMTKRELAYSLMFAR